MSRRPKPVPWSFLTTAPASTSDAAGPAPMTPTPVVRAIERSVVPAVDVAVAEALGFPFRWLRELPLPSTLVCSFAHGGGRVALCTCSLPAADPPPAPAFVGPELPALALAAEHERANAATLRAWIARKPAWRLTELEAIAGLGYRPQPCHWTTEQVLGALGLRLDEVRQ